MHAYFSHDPQAHQSENQSFEPDNTKRGYADMQFAGDDIHVPEEALQRLRKINEHKAERKVKTKTCNDTKTKKMRNTETIAGFVPGGS